MRLSRLGVPLVLVALLLIVLVFYACGSEDDYDDGDYLDDECGQRYGGVCPEKICTPETSRSCMCPDETTGTQTCNVTGTAWGRCRGCDGVDEDGDELDGEPAEGTWPDPTTGLIWENPPSEETMLWDEAKAYCRKLQLGGSSNWRLPTISELRSLARNCPELEEGGACNVESGGCVSVHCRDAACQGCSTRREEDSCRWPEELEGTCFYYKSNTPVKEFKSYPWRINFRSGALDFTTGDDGSDPNRSLRDYVRCVR